MAVSERLYLLDLVPFKKSGNLDTAQKTVEGLHFSPFWMPPKENPFTENEYSFSAEEYWFGSDED